MSTTLDFATQLASIEARDAVKALAAGTCIEDMLRTAMRETREHWCLEEVRAGETARVRAAVAGVILALGQDHPDARRLAIECRNLIRLNNALAAARGGVSIDWEGMNAEQEPLENPVGIINRWHEVTS